MLLAKFLCVRKCGDKKWIRKYFFLLLIVKRNVKSVMPNMTSDNRIEIFNRLRNHVRWAGILMAYRGCTWGWRDSSSGRSCMWRDICGKSVERSWRDLRRINQNKTKPLTEEWRVPPRRSVCRCTSVDRTRTEGSRSDECPSATLLRSSATVPGWTSTVPGSNFPCWTERNAGRSRESAEVGKELDFLYEMIQGALKD